MLSLQRVFHLKENQTTVRRELLGGLTTFMIGKLGCGKRREVSSLIWALTVLFILRYAFLGFE